MNNEFTQQKYKGIVDGIFQHEDPEFATQKALKREDVDPYFLRQYVQNERLKELSQWNDDTLKVPELLNDDVYMDSMRWKQKVFTSAIDILNEHILETKYGKAGNQKEAEMSANTLPEYFSIFKIPMLGHNVKAAMEKNSEWERVADEGAKNKYFLAMVDSLREQEKINPEVTDKVAFEVIFKEIVGCMPKTSLVNEKPGYRFDKYRNTTKYKEFKKKLKEI